MLRVKNLILAGQKNRAKGKRKETRGRQTELISGDEQYQRGALMRNGSGDEQYQRGALMRNGSGEEQRDTLMIDSSKIEASSSYILCDVYRTKSSSPQPALTTPRLVTCPNPYPPMCPENEIGSNHVMPRNLLLTWRKLQPRAAK
jgi:hypothetical protein